MGADDPHVASAGPNSEFIRLLRNLAPIGLRQSSPSCSFPSSASRRFWFSPTAQRDPTLTAAGRGQGAGVVRTVALYRSKASCSVLPSGLVDPQPSPQTVSSCAACEIPGSPSVLVSCCKTQSNRTFQTAARAFFATGQKSASGKSARRRLTDSQPTALSHSPVLPG